MRPNTISQLRAKGRIDGQILSATLSLDRDMMTKKLQIWDRVDNMAKTVALDAFQKNGRASHRPEKVLSKNYSKKNVVL